jgi:hypothetical protein
MKVQIEIEHGIDRETGKEFYSADRKRYFFVSPRCPEDYPAQKRALYAAVWDFITRDSWLSKHV